MKLFKTNRLSGQRRSVRIKAGVLAILVASIGIVAVSAAPASAAVGTSIQQAAQLLVDAHAAGKLTTVPASIYDEEIAPAATAGGARADCTVDLRVFQVLNLAIDRFGSVEVTDIQRPCIGSDLHCGAPTYSVHCASPGLALDVDNLGGQSVNGSNAVTLQYLDMLNNYATGPGGNGIGINAGQSTCGARSNSWAHIHTFDDTCNHQHIDFRNISAPLNLGAQASFDNTFASVQSNGDAIAKTGLGSTWSTLSNGAAELVTAQAASGPVFAMRTTGGSVYSKDSLTAPWVLQTTGSVDVALAADPHFGASLASIQANGDLIAKTGLGTPWSTLTNSAKDVSLASDAVHGLTVAAVLQSGNVISKAGIGGAWTTIVSPGAKVSVASDTNFGTTYVVLSTGGAVWAKTGLASGWTTITSGSKSISVASDAVHGATIGSVQTNGDGIVKTGITGPWTTVVNGAEELALRSDATAGLTIVDRLTSGNVFVKLGLGGTWTGVLSGSTQIDIAR